MISICLPFLFLPLTVNGIQNSVFAILISSMSQILIGRSQAGCCHNIPLSSLFLNIQQREEVGYATSLPDSTGRFTTSSYLCCSHGLREVKSQSFTEKLYSLPLHSKKSIVFMTSVTSLCGRLFPNHSASRIHVVT